MATMQQQHCKGSVHHASRPLSTPVSLYLDLQPTASVFFPRQRPIVNSSGTTAGSNHSDVVGKILLLKGRKRLLGSPSATTFIQHTNLELQSLKSVFVELMLEHLSHDLVVDFFIVSLEGATRVDEWWKNLVHQPLSPTNDPAAFWFGVWPSSLWPSVLQHEYLDRLC